MDVGVLRAELELDAATFRRDLDQAGNQFRQLGQTADRMAQQVDTAWRSAGQGAERSADGIGAAYRQEATRAEQSASGIGGAFQQAGSRAEGSASGIGSAYRQEAARAESAASGVGSAWRSAGEEGEQSASGIGDAYRNAMERAQASAQGAGETSGGSFVAAFGSRIAALGSRGGPIGLALGATVGVGALAGAKLADTVFDGFHIQAERDFSQASFGFTDEQMERVGTAAGASFGNAWGESVNANINTAGIAMQSGLLDGDATAAEIQPVIEQLSFVSSMMGEEIPAVARAAGQMIKTNLVETPQQAFDLLTAAQQGGLNLSQDLLDSMNEYGVQWQKLGMDGAQAMGTISQLMQGGARDTDIAADVFKEFSLRVIDGSESTAEAFQSLNLNAEETSAAFGKGGEAANEMADTVIDRLNAIEDPVERNRLGLALFGTQWEDLGGAINNLDLSDAKNEMAATNSTLDAMAIAGGGAGASIEAAKNKISVAADEMKVKLAEAFAPMAVDAATWVGEHQNEILGFFASVGTAALDVSAALLNVGAAGMYLGSYMMEGLAGAAQGFIPFLYVVEQIGAAMSHLPGDAGKAGEAIRDQARGAIEGVRGMNDYGNSMRDAAGVMNDLAGQLRDGKITLEEFGSRMALATTISNNLGGELEFVRQGVLNIPDSKSIIISDNSPETEKRLTDLGFKVETLPDGTVKVIADDAEAQEKLRLITEPRSKVINIEVRDPTGLVYNPNIGGSTAAREFHANGAIREYADGGVNAAGQHVAREPMIASGGANILWGEKETGWEAYISGKPSELERNKAIWLEAGQRLGIVQMADGGVLGSIQAVQQQAAPTLTLTSGVRNEPGSYHNTGQAGDFGPPGGGRDTDDMLAFANYMADNYRGQLAELIYHDSRFSGRQVGDGAFVDDSYYAGAGDHHDHVHVAAEQPLTPPAGMAMEPAEIEVPVLSTDSSKEDVARAIIAQGRKRGYTDDEIKAILATGMQESGLSPSANGGNGAWHGVFQQDESYAGRDDPNQNIDEFYNRLDEKHKGQAGGDIWEDIFWLQQRPGDTSGASAVANGRQGYLTEIQSQSDDAGALFDQVAPSVGTVPPADGAGAPAGVQQVYVVGGRLDGASPAATTPSAPAPPSTPAAPEIVGRGPLPLVAYENGGTIPGVGNEDSELLLGMPGEEIISKGPAEEWRPFLKAINAGKIRRFASGGTVGFGGYSDDTTDAMKPKNWYDWAALTAGVGFAAASVVTPYVNMAMSGQVNLGSVLPTMDTSANSVDGVSAEVGKFADAVLKQLEELIQATRDGKKVHPVDPNSGAGMILSAAGL
ncbi:phage tail tape measure protein [Williamsia sp. DF01-3]|uniref:phage tail tape measure protein n=1 Tax=Williamsia sp. DF01-3 TaxID=2934157 RepID=UPI001FF3F1BB|nr:phage tail tape measure protein [Williamsia sp. DF01-3]MCK0516972.1 phage tail tape measure protein [Williamsia sp. DF01-3]